MALGAQRADELRDVRAERNDHARLPCGGGHDAHVLVVQVDAEAGLELAGAHACGLALEDLVAGQPAGQDPHRRLTDVAKRVAEEGTVRGFLVVDAPVSGGQSGAVQASLSIMVGGAAEDVEAARPILETMGKTVVHVGPAGSGQTVKAANQLIVAGTARCRPAGAVRAR